MKSVNWTRVATVLRIVDENGNLSLTNLALIGATIKLLATPQLALPDLMTFAAGLASYQFKRYLNPAAPEVDDNSALKAAIETLQTKVTSLQIGTQIKR